jgi:hypothetical protein
LEGKMRTKVVEIKDDEKKYKIGALSLAQVEDYISPLEVVTEGITMEKPQAKIKAYDLVCYGLNNALSLEERTTENIWTNERVRQELDMVSFRELQLEILKLSGLTIIDEPKLGEAPAVTES